MDTMADILCSPRSRTITVITKKTVLRIRENVVGVNAENESSKFHNSADNLIHYNTQDHR